MLTRITITLGMMLALAGCHDMMKSDKGSMSSMGHMNQIVATSNHGVAVFTPQSNGTVTVASSGDMAACEQCKSDAAMYMSTGKISEVCSVCGAHRYAVSPMMHGHN